MVTDRRRPIGVSITRDTVERFSTGQRETQRAARAYAESWYAALRAWRVLSYEVERPASSGRGGAVLLTSGSCAVLEVNYLSTPLGRSVGEVHAARTISTWAISSIPAQREAGQLLERVRGGGGPQTLLRETGAWVHPTESARAYAVAVLTLAVTLGDEEAESALSTLQRVVD